jgi:hypothetical protein
MECDLADQPYSFCFINGNYEAKAGKMAYWGSLPFSKRAECLLEFIHPYPRFWI